MLEIFSKKLLVYTIKINNISYWKPMYYISYGGSAGLASEIQIIFRFSKILDYIDTYCKVYANEFCDVGNLLIKNT